MAHSIKMVLNTFFQTQDNWKCQLLSAWPFIIGDLKNQVQIEKIHDNFLVLGVHNSCLMHELYLLSPMLINTINQKLSEPRIKKIRFKTISSTSHYKKKYIAQKQSTLCKVVPLSAQEQAALKRIEDPGLQDALHKFLMRCHQE